MGNSDSDIGGGDPDDFGGGGGGGGSGGSSGGGSGTPASHVKLGGVLHDVGFDEYRGVISAGTDSGCDAGRGRAAEPSSMQANEGLAPEELDSMGLDASTIRLFDRLCAVRDGWSGATEEDVVQDGQHDDDDDDEDEEEPGETMFPCDDEEVKENLAIFSRAAAEGGNCSVVAELLESSLRGAVIETLNLMGFEAFLSPQQEASTIAVAEGRDVAVNLPTAGGKSLVYLLPIFGEYMQVLTPKAGVTLILSPVVALSREQHSNFFYDGSSVYIDQDTPYLERQRLLARIENDSSVLAVHSTFSGYVKSVSLRSSLDIRGVDRNVIDEYHILREWIGFAPELVDVLDFIFRQTGCPQIVLLSATVESDVTKEISRVLGREIAVVKAPLVRPNTRLSVTVLESDSLRDVCRALSSRIKRHHPAQKGIIYAATPSDVVSIHKHLCRHGHRCLFFHGKLAKPSDKERALNFFSSGEDLFDIIVATVAFGMGVSLPRIRFVFHVDLPASRSEGIQKDGRGGRKQLELCDSMLFLVPERAFRLLVNVYGHSDVSRSLFCQSIVSALDVTCCRQVKQGLWPVAITLSERCSCRCDACLRRNSQRVFELEVDIAARDLLRVMVSMHRRGLKCGFSALVREWNTSTSQVAFSSVHGAPSLGVLLLLFIGLGYVSYDPAAPGDLQEAPALMLHTLSLLFKGGQRSEKMLVAMPEGRNK